MNLVVFPRNPAHALPPCLPSTFRWRDTAFLPCVWPSEPLESRKDSNCFDGAFEKFAALLRRDPSGREVEVCIATQVPVDIPAQSSPRLVSQNESHRRKQDASLIWAEMEKGP